MSRGGPDEASVLILVEVILVAVLVLAVGLPLMMGSRDDPGASDTDADWRRLAEGSHDLLDVLGALAPANLTTGEADGELGTSLLDRLVRENFLDRSAAKWQWASIERGIIKDTSVRAQVGYRVQHRNVTFLGNEHGEPTGEAVVASRIVEPVWNGVYAWPRATPVDGVSTLDFDAVFVNESRIVRQEGEALRFVVRVGGGTTPGSSVLSPAVQTTSYGLIGQSPDAGVPMANLKWRRLAHRDYDGEGSGSIDAPGISEQWNQPLTYSVEVTAVGAAIPVGALLHLRAEKGFEPEDLAVKPGEGWDPHSVATLPDGSVELVAKRASTPIAAGSSAIATFEMNAFPRCGPPCVGVPAPNAATLPPPFSRLHAWLSDGAMGRTTAIIRHEATTTRDASTPLAVFPSLPYALQHDPDGGVSRARLGAVVQNGASATFIHTFRIEVPGGYDLRRFDGLGPPIFDTASTVTPGFVGWRCFEVVTVCDPAGVPPAARSGGASPVGSWRIASERAVEWTGGRLELPPYSIASFLVDVPVKYAGNSPGANGVTLRGTAFADGQPGYFGSEVKFTSNGFAALPTDGPGAWRAAPGVARHAAGPATATEPGGGYPTVVAGGGQLGPNYMTGRLTWDRPTMVGPRGNAAKYDYSTGLPSLQGLAANAANATLEPAARTYRPGDTAAFTANYEGVVRYLQSLGPAVQSVKLTTELYAPPSLPGAPLVRSVRDVTGVLNSRALDMASGDFAVPNEAHEEVAVGLEDGSVYAVTADAGTAAPVQPYAWKTLVTPSAPDKGIRRVIVADVSPNSAGREVLVAAGDGAVKLLRASDGLLVWTASGATVGEHLIDASWDASYGRVLVLVETSMSNVNAVTFRATDGARLSTVTLPNVRATEPMRIVPFTRATGTRGIAVLDANGAVTGVDASGATIGGYGREAPVPPLTGLLAAASGEADASLAGDELLVAYPTQMASYRADGTVWSMQPIGRSLAGLGDVVHGHAAYSFTGTPAPEMLVTLADGTLIMYTLESSGAFGTVWELELVDQSVGPPCGAPPEPWFPGLCENAVFSPGLPVGATMLRDPTAAGAPDVVAFGSKSAAGVIRMTVRRADTGALVWQTPDAAPPPGMPTHFVAVGRDDGTAPMIAAATDDGAVLMRSWTTAANMWTQRVAPGGEAGTFTSYVRMPDGALPGSYVVRTNLSWEREVAPGTFVRQEANLANYVDVTWPDGAPLDGQFLLPVELRTWRRDWT